MCYIPPESHLIEARDILRHDFGVIKSLDTLQRVKRCLERAINTLDGYDAPARDEAFELFAWVTERQSWYGLPPLGRALREAREVYEDALRTERRAHEAVATAERRVDDAWLAFRDAGRALGREMNAAETTERMAEKESAKEGTP